jgi:hypothetical protein
MTPEEYVKNANNRIAAYRYYVAKSKYGDYPTADERQYLSDYKSWLTTHYPGYGDQTPNYNELPSLVRELSATVKNPELAKTDAGKGLAMYLKARQGVIDDARSNGITGWTSARASQDGRSYLADYGKWLTTQHPGFKQMWDWVWSREVHAKTSTSGAPGPTARASAQAASPTTPQPVSSTPWTTQGGR